MAGPQCCETPPPRDHPTVGVGKVEAFHDLAAYVTGSPDAAAAIILIADIFGYEAPNLRKLADKVAEAGYFVVVPDFFYGDPYVPDRVTLQDWIKNHGPEKGFEDAVKVIDVLKSRGITSIGAAGFCWGAKVAVELAKGVDIKAGVFLHPSFVTVDDIKAVIVPIAILGAEIDRMSPPELLKQFEVILSEKAESYPLTILHSYGTRTQQGLPGLGLETWQKLKETFEHLFFGCQHAFSLWSMSLGNLIGKDCKDVLTGLKFLMDFYS